MSRSFAADGAVDIVGIGTTAFTRRGGRPVIEMVLEAITAAVEDAGLELTAIDGVVTESDLVTRHVTVHDIVANLGLRDDVFHARRGLGGAGTTSTPLLAGLALRAGLATHVVAYFGVDWGTTDGAYGWHGEDPFKASLEMPFGYYGQPTYFAALARRYMALHGAADDDLAPIAVSARAWAQLNPAAQQREPLSTADYLASPMISEPLRKADCCLLSDGAVAFVMTTPERARDLRHRPVNVAACESSVSAESLHSWFTQKRDPLVAGVGRPGARALARAGLTPADVDVLGLYDCFTICCLLQLEDLGFCERGEALEVYRAGRASPGGDLPINTNGGMLNEAYLLSANNIVEVVRQLRGTAGERQVPGALVGLVSDYGPESTVLVLTASDR